MTLSRRDTLHLAAAIAATRGALLAVEDAVRDDQDLQAVLGLLADLDEEATDLATVAWMGGVRAGAAYEHLRLAVAIPTEQCPRCDGYGRPREDRRAGRSGAESSACSTCNGQGFVSLRRPVLELATD